MKPADVMEIEIYSDEEIAQWDEEDRLEPIEREALLKNLRGALDPIRPFLNRNAISYSDGLRIFGQLSEAKDQETGQEKKVALAAPPCIE